MPPPRRLWDSMVILNYLGGLEEGKVEVEGILTQAGRGNLQIVVSTLAIAEVAYLDGYSDEVAERMFREFFSRDYIIVAAIDQRIAEIAQGIVRRRRRERTISPRDALHLATAVRFEAPFVETSDRRLLLFNGLEGNPPIQIRQPLYAGTIPLPGM